jgi:DNA polymerase III alpha subunit (gram-positive type)
MSEADKPETIEPSVAPNSLVNLKGNLLCAVDVETTGRMAGYHEVIQIGVQPLTSEITPMKDVMPFYINIAPDHPEREEKSATRVHGLNIADLVENAPSQWKAADLFDEWFQKLKLPFGKQLVPLAHNYPFERGFLTHWLGMETFNQIWHFHPRDTMLFAVSINDACAYHGKRPPYDYVGLGSMCAKYGITIDNAHDALCDARAEAELYKRMLSGFG